MLQRLNRTERAMAHLAPGPAPQVEKQEEFVRLLAGGVER